MYEPAGLSMDGYVRVSQVGIRRGERFISPAVQREQIADWARLTGTRVLEVFEELDESGGRGDRPVLERAIRRIEDGVSQGLVVAKVDRFGRSLLDGLAAIKHIQDAGGRFVSVRDGLDVDTDAGRLVLRIMLSMAEFELERQRAGYAISKAKAIERGVYIGGYVPVGYEKTSSGRLVPDRRTAPLIRQLFERRAAGEGTCSLSVWLQACGVRTPKGNPGWTATTVSALLKRRVYLGEVSCAPHIREGAHPALIDPVTWELAQRPRYRGPRHARNDALLRGLVRCASCGMAMSVIQYPKQRCNVYCCHRRYAAGTCPAAAYMTAYQLERRVEYMMFDLLGRRREMHETGLRAAENRARDAQRSLAAYRDSPQILNALGPHEFADGLATRTEQLRVARLEVGAMRSKVATHSLPPTAQLMREWPRMSIPSQRDIIAVVLDCVIVRPGREDYDRRISVCPAGTGPRTLPRPGDRETRLQSYPHRREWVRPTERPLATQLAQRAGASQPIG